MFTTGMSLYTYSGKKNFQNPWRTTFNTCTYEVTAIFTYYMSIIQNNCFKIPHINSAKKGSTLIRFHIQFKYYPEYLHYTHSSKL